MISLLKNNLFNKSRKYSERGITIIENLVAISLLSIVLASSSNMIIMAMQSNGSARGYASMVSQVQQKIDQYRNGSYSTLLAKFGSTYSSITDGQTATETSSYDGANTTFTTTFTAIKSSNTAFPEAIQIKVSALQRRGRIGNVAYDFETVIAQMGT